MPQTNPRWLITQAPGDLKAQIQKAVSAGYHVTSQTATTAQLMRQKHFSCLLATVLFIFFAIPFFIYLFYYLAKKDDAIYLDIETQPTGEALKQEIEKFNNRPWYQKHPYAAAALAIFLLPIVVSAFSGFYRARTIANTEQREIKQVFDVPSLFGKSLGEMKTALGTPKEETQPPKLQIQNGTTGEEYISWEKDGAKLTVTYVYKTRKIVDFFVSVDDPSGATKDKTLLLGAGGLKEGDSRYSVKFVEVINPPTPGLYTGVTVTPR